MYECKVALWVCLHETICLVLLGFVVTSLKEGQKSPDVEGRSTEAMGAESKKDKLVNT